MAPEFPGQKMYPLKVIPISSINEDELKKQLAKYSSVANVMERLTTGIAQRNKDTFFPLSKPVRQANITTTSHIPKVYDELTVLGFHLRRIPRQKSGGRKFHYYYAHISEVPAIVSYLKDKYRAENPIRLIFGPADTPIPTITEFKKQCVSVFKTVCEVTGLRFSARLTPEVLKIIFQENAPVSVFAYYHPQYRLVRTPQDSLEIFKAQVLGKKEEIIAFLEAHHHKS